MRIVDLRGDREPLVTVLPLEDIPILRQHGARAVRNAVLAEVSRTQTGRDDLHRPAGRQRRRSAACSSGHGAQKQRNVGARSVPLGDRRPLPGRRALGRLPFTKVKQSRLHSGIRLDFQRHIVLPGDVQTPGDAHQSRGAVRPALLARRFVLRRIPRVGDPLAFVVYRDVM